MNLVKTTIAAALALASAVPMYAGRERSVSRETLPAQNQAVDPNSSGRTMEQFADSFRLDVPEESIKKWGTKVKIQELCPGNYIVTGENEPWPDCPTGPDPTRVLTTFANLEHCDPEFFWKRHDGLSELVSDYWDIDRMTLKAIKAPGVEINNLRADYEGFGRFPMLTEQRVTPATKVGLNKEDIRNTCTTPFVTIEQYQMHTWMRGESDPHSLLTIRPIGVGTNGHGLYELVLYKIDPTNSEGEEQRMLTAHFDYGNGEMRRIDAQSRLDPNCGVSNEPGHQPYSKIYGWVPVKNAEGRVIGEDKRYGVDNCQVGGAGGFSDFNVEELERERVSAFNLPPTTGITAPPGAGPVVPPTTGGVSSLDVKCYNAPGGAPCDAKLADSVDNTTRNLRFRNGGIEASVSIYTKGENVYDMQLHNADATGQTTVCVDLPGNNDPCVGPMTSYAAGIRP